jgi:hypothetical protein
MTSSHVLTVFDARSRDTASDLFSLLPGWTGEILAFGFRLERVWPNPGGRSVLQAACLNQVLLTSPPPTVVPDGGCGVTTVFPRRHDEVLAEGPVVHDGCAVGVSACDTRVWLWWPGIYRLVLNDPAALGQVQVFVQSYPRNMLGINP